MAIRMMVWAALATVFSGEVKFSCGKAMELVANVSPRATVWWRSRSLKGDRASLKVLKILRLTTSEDFGETGDFGPGMEGYLCAACTFEQAISTAKLGEDGGSPADATRNGGFGELRAILDFEMQ